MEISETLIVMVVVLISVGFGLLIAKYAGQKVAGD